jgi:hypothetical protein
MSTPGTTGAESSSQRYDKVELNHPDGTRRTLSPEDFEALSLLERVAVDVAGPFPLPEERVKIPSHEALKREKKS